MTDNNEGRLIIGIPAGRNYIEILGHRIDGFESFEAFLEHLKKYAELEETVKSQKAEIERLEDLNECYYTSCQQIAKSNHEIKAEAIKQFAERLKESKIDIDVSFGYGREVYTEAVAVIEIDNLVEEMAGENNAPCN